MMIHWFDDGLTETAKVGGKGSSLIEMQAAGLPVPPGFCVSVEGYQEFHQSAGLGSLVAELSAHTELASSATATRAVAPLLQHLEGSELPAGLRSQIESAYRALCDRLGGRRLVAARSTAISEDGVNASFAGIYETFLHLDGAERVTSSVLDCYRALWDARAVQYRATRGVDQAAEQMAVVVMGMIPSEVAGVAFSANPITGNRDEVLINASWGLGESVVSGQVTPDNVLAAKSDGRLLSYDVGEKSIEITLDEQAGAGTIERAVEPERATQRCLSDEDVAAIVEMTRRAEEHYGVPQDIEFARADGEWYLLQARPITALG